MQKERVRETEPCVHSPSGGGDGKITRRDALKRLGGSLGVLALGPDLLSRSPGCSVLSGKRIRWLVGVTPGGTYDLYSRLIEPFLEEAIRAEVFVENVPGSGGVVAARRLARARPDGRTLAIVNGAGLLTAPWSNPEHAPDLHEDLTILARVARHRPLLFTGPESRIASVEDLVRVGREKGLVLGVTGPTSVNTLLSAALEGLVGAPIELVFGFPGSTEVLAAVRRGDVDGAVLSHESVSRLPDLKPIVSFGRGTDSWASEVPTLGGKDGLFTHAPEWFPGDPSTRQRELDALLTLLEVGRLVVAPAGLPAPLASCLGEALVTLLRDSRFEAVAARARLPVEPGTAAEVQLDLLAAEAALPELRVTMERVARKVRR